MKHKNIFYLPLALCALCLVSCNDFLGEMPDNRTELDTEAKIINLLVSAYPINDYIKVAELSSDNIDDYGASNPNSSRFLEQVYRWEDSIERNSESVANIWSANYTAIASANQALAAIAELGNPESMNAAKGEALVCRAYGHFNLVNIFSQHYNKEYADRDLGITYMEHVETELNPHYKRNTVAEVYAKIEADLVAGLPLINDAIYSVPKYHFNVKAANAFASRFYLFYQKWDKAIECATTALGTSPQNLLRDNISLAALPRKPLNKVSESYVSAANKCNFLLQTAYSDLGAMFGSYYANSRFSHGRKLSKTETLETSGPWGFFTIFTFHLIPWVYSGTNIDKVLLPRLPYVFEYTDAVSQIGYKRTVYTAFTAEETLLNRAEAYIMKKDYTNALKDLNLWVANNIKRGESLTEKSIQTWVKSMGYYTPMQPTPKKHLNPAFTVEAGLQEDFVHCLLYIRRYETLHMGLRWFDVKRYGIELTRRTIQSGEISSLGDVLKPRDKRCALQLPPEVISAGLTPNPR